MTRQESSDLFRWLAKEGRVGEGCLVPEQIDEICYFIEGDERFLIDELREFREQRDVFGIGTQPRLQG